MMHKFLLRSEPLSAWDGFVAELNNLGVQELLDIYDEAYRRVAE